MQYELFLEKTPYEDFEIFNENVFSKFAQGAAQGYQSGKEFAQGDFEKFAGRAQAAIQKGSQFADYMSKKTGVSPALALAMTVAGITGGASALPMAAIMYFARKHINQMLVNPVSNLVDLAFDAADKKKQQNFQYQSSSQPQMPQYDSKKSQRMKRQTMPIDFSSLNEPKQGKNYRKRQERKKQYQDFLRSYGKYESNQNISFKDWLFVEEEKEGWMDWGARMLGKGIGAVGGAVVGYSKSVLNALGNRIKEIYDYVSGNPRQAVKLASIVGLSMLTGAVVGKISHDVVSAVSNKISGVTGVNAGDVHNSVSQAAGLSEKGAGDFSGSASSGDFGSPEQGFSGGMGFYGKDINTNQNMSGTGDFSGGMGTYGQDFGGSHADAAIQAKSGATQATFDAKAQATRDLLKAQDAQMDAEMDAEMNAALAPQQDMKNMMNALRNNLGVKSHSLNTSGIPHGMKIDLNGDGIPDNPSTSYFNTNNKIYYGDDGKPLWKWDGKNIIKLK